MAATLDSPEIAPPAGMSPRPLEGARAGLPHSCYGVHILWQETPIAMGRIVGDGAINFDIVDVAVDPAHQGKGLGRLVMEKLVAWLEQFAANTPAYAATAPR